LVTPASGTVAVGGRDVASIEPTALRRATGYVIQAVGLFAHMTVGQNIAVVPDLLHWDRERIARRTNELLELVGLDPQRYRARFPRELSGGEQQRVGVARAIAAEPQVLLMDEPFGAVDAIARRSLQDEMLRIVRTLQTTVLFVTHDVEEALRLADRIAVMRNGKLLQYAAPEEMLRAPANPYIAQLFAVNADLRRYDTLRNALGQGP
jgi:osmoprotectant transport system ATP-binding protein